MSGATATGVPEFRDDSYPFPDEEEVVDGGQGADAYPYPDEDDGADAHDESEAPGAAATAAAAAVGDPWGERPRAAAARMCVCVARAIGSVYCGVVGCCVWHSRVRSGASATR